MVIRVIDAEIFRDDQLIFTAPAKVLNVVECGDGVIVHYDGYAVAPPRSPLGWPISEKPTPRQLFTAKKNILKIDYSGNEVWQVRVSFSETGYTSIWKCKSSGDWVVGDGTYEQSIDLATGALGPPVRC